MDKITTIKQSAKSILTGNIESAKNLINKEYPFKKLKPEGRSYTDKEKYEQFVRDGFIDRYTGEKLATEWNYLSSLLFIHSGCISISEPLEDGRMSQCLLGTGPNN